MIGVDCLPSIPLVVAATSAHNAYSASLSVQDICAVADCRPNFLALAKAGLGRLEILSDHRQAGDGRRLAPEGFPFVLDVGKSTVASQVGLGFPKRFAI